VIEAAQQFLPGRTAETTDPVLAIVLGLILLRLDHKYGADPGTGVPPPTWRATALPRAATDPGMPTRTHSPYGSRGSGRKVWTAGRRSGL